jgi:hypothetical protein
LNAAESRGDATANARRTPATLTQIKEGADGSAQSSLQRRREDGRTMKQNRFLIAVFDEWEAVGSVLADLGTERIGRAGALLHIRKDEPPTLTASWLVQDMAELHFAPFRERVRCTAGRLAEALSKRSAGGVHDLAGALRGWMSLEQAREVQWHMEKGRIVLWLEPQTSQDVDTACARLVQASPHLVELCNVDSR